MRMIPRLGECAPDVGDVLVSVIIPARNEAGSIGNCLDSLLAQEGVRLEVIVVDDSSSDGTAEVVGRYGGVRLIKLENPPEGWLGKSWACEIGYRASSGSWLLFTDADVVFHDRLFICKALKHAREKGVDAATLYPTLRMDALSLKAITPILTLALYALVKPHKVEDRGSAFMFGSFILIRRDAYVRIGGHAAVRDALLEDRAMAMNARKAGLKVVFADGGGAFSAEWNRDLRTLWNGLLRLFLPLFMKGPVKRTASYTSLIILLSLIPSAGLLYSLILGLQPLLIISSLALSSATVAIAAEARKHKAGVLPLILWPLGSVLTAAAAVATCYKALRNPTVEWRGRRYRLVLDGERERAVRINP